VTVSDSVSMTLHITQGERKPHVAKSRQKVRVNLFFTDSFDLNVNSFKQMWDEIMARESAVIQRKRMQTTDLQHIVQLFAGINVRCVLQRVVCEVFCFGTA